MSVLVFVLSWGQLYQKKQVNCNIFENIIDDGIYSVEPGYDTEINTTGVAAVFFRLPDRLDKRDCYWFWV